jgi:Invasion associated locus B (IalB) protein
LLRRPKRFILLRMKKITLSLLALLAFTSPALASEQKEIGTFGVWSAYVFEENGGKVCYMAAKPEKAEGKYSKRGDVVAMITHRPAEGTKNVFSYMSGYGYKKGSDVNLMVDAKKFTLFTQNDMAWAADAGADTNIAEAIKKGSKMVVKGVSGKGTETKDSFSLKGSTKAYEAITTACGL